MEKSWVADFPQLGTNSSPRCADLNGDGVLDVVLGAGRNEFEACEHGVIALDGRTGALLWSHPAEDQVVGSALFLDVTADSIPDVFIGGRKAQLFALDGATGQELWHYEVLSEEYGTLGLMRFNFYNPQTLPDQDGDGLPDLLVANGGNVLAAAGSTEQRFPGVLAVFSSRSGALLAADTMPDRRETYMSPLVADLDADGTLDLLFGTGGETIGGSLFRATLDELLNNDLSKARPLLTRTGHGFIAPPALTDLNGDQTLDIVGNWHGGMTYAIDGRSHELLWSVELPDAEASNSLALGFFSPDTVPDVFTFFSLGTWPENRAAVQLMLDGRDGRVLLQDTLGCSGFFSPVALDLENDGRDEVLLGVNAYPCRRYDFERVRYHLELFDFRRGIHYPFTPELPAKNVSSTPWVGDLDGDHYLDIIHCPQVPTTRMDSFFGFQVQRISSNVKIESPPRWGAYMGPGGRGVFLFQ